MSKPIRILLQTTIPAVSDDWHIDRFSLLAEHLSSITNGEGSALCEVTTRNREKNGDGNDPVLSRLDETDFDELWLFAVDAGHGLTVRIVRASLAFFKEVVGFLPHEIIRI